MICRLTKVSTAFGDTSYQYDTLDRITRVIDRNGYATVYEYDANGNRTAVKYANGLTVSYEYDKLNRLISEETVDSDSNIVVKYIYTLGASGERIKVEELDRTVEYTYDELYRLTSETITKGKKVTTYTYAYDSVSNRTLKTVNGVETVYTYNALNQLISENDTTYEYDNAGNLVRVVGAGKTALYVYNVDNKLVKATVQQGNNVVVESYTYDYAGNRTSKTTTINNHVEKVYYLNDNSSLTNVLAELNVDGEVKVYYTIGADLISQEVNGKVYTYLYDGHGTVRALANESGKLTDTYTYDVFGNLLNSTGTTANNYRYCGEQFDSTTCLYYLRARYMDTSTGRFISMDTYQGTTADPISLHKYLYANSNPVMYTDPSGYMVATLKKPSASAIVLWAQLESMAASYAMAMWNLFLTYLPTVMVAATGFAKIIMDSPAYMDILQQFASGNLSIYDLQQQVIEAAQKVEQKVRDYINEARSEGSSNNSSGGSSSNNSGSSAPEPPDPNKLNHIFEKVQHNLDNFLNEFNGDQARAYSAVEKAAQEYVTQNNITGVINGANQITINVSGYNITFRGNVVDGVLHLGTFFIQ